MVTTFSQDTFQFFIILISALRRLCKQYYLYYIGQNKGYNGLLQLFSVKFIFLDEAMNSGKNVKIRDFHKFLFEPTQIQTVGV